MDVCVFGNSPEELEFAALDEARKFFGEDLQLDVVRSYQVVRPVLSQHQEAAAKLKKTYMAFIDVRVVE